MWDVECFEAKAGQSGLLGLRRGGGLGVDKARALLFFLWANLRIRSEPTSRNGGKQSGMPKRRALTS